MGTERAYYQPLDALHAEIREIRFGEDAAQVVLDKTIFYPEAGGQPGDRGWINRAAVLDTQERDGEIFHRVSLEHAAALATGAAEIRLDTERRRDLTVHHTAQHLLSGIILSRAGVPTASMRLGEQVGTIDLETPAFPPDALQGIEEEAADAIEADHPVLIHLCPPESPADFPLRKSPPPGEEVIRVVEIQTRDFSPCCGTHLLSTGGIGILRILMAEKHKAMTRIYFIAGRRVLRESRMLRRESERVSRSLKVPVMEIGGALAALLEKTALLERRLSAREEEAALVKARELARQEDGAGVITLFMPDAEIREVMRIGRAAEKLTGRVILLGCGQERKFAGFRGEKNGEKSVDLRRLLKAPMEQRGGKGGGSASLFQGQFPSEQGLIDFMRAIAEGEGAKGEGIEKEPVQDHL